MLNSQASQATNVLLTRELMHAMALDSLHIVGASQEMRPLRPSPSLVHNNESEGSISMAIDGFFQTSTCGVLDGTAETGASRSQGREPDLNTLPIP